MMESTCKLTLDGDASPEEDGTIASFVCSGDSEKDDDDDDVPTLTVRGAGRTISARQKDDMSSTNDEKSINSNSNNDDKGTTYDRHPLITAGGASSIPPFGNAIRLDGGSHCRRHGFQTRVALLFASMSVVALAGLAGWTRLSGGVGSGFGSDFGLGAAPFLSSSHSSSFRQVESLNRRRRMEEDGSGNGDYSAYSCDEIFDRTEAGSTDRCSYARTCNGGDGLYVKVVFCNGAMSTFRWCIVLSPLLLIWLVTLFRMLGTTAEDYFSPSLEMFSLKMGLPPRFAGVTLLALGNGAADVSATISAFVMDPERGYQMSLGALTGAGMFVGTVVAGVVIVIAGGVPCRGALVRDVVVFLLTSAVVYGILKRGIVGPGAITTFFATYATFVTIVLIADIYHRAVVLPRLEQMASRRRGALEAVGEAPDEDEEEAASVDRENCGGGQAPAVAIGSGTLDAALSQEDSTSGDVGTEMRLDVPSRGNMASGRTASIRLLTDVAGAGADAGEVVPIRSRRLNRILMALSNYDRYEETGTSTMDPLRGAEGWSVAPAALEVGSATAAVAAGGRTGTGVGGRDRPVVLHGRDGVLNRHHHNHRADGIGSSHSTDGGDAMGGTTIESDSPYSAMVDQIDLDGICAEGGSMGFGAHSWCGAWHDGREELRVHCRETWDDIVHNDENSVLDKFLLICELPFTVMRKLSVPIPCEGYYCRALVALSLAISPLWIGTYMFVKRNINLFWAGGFPYVLVLLAVFSVLGALVMRYAPGGDANMSLFVSGPIALYGFIVAATWIDSIADQLVGLLGFLGVILRIPGSVMGLTVLAWGNSMGDLSANMTMARKGLANMAITACFAGPVFNILIGLGGGFSALRGITGSHEKEVTLTPSIEAGFLFLVFNCLLLLISGIGVNKGRVPAGYGYAALALYLVYVATSLILQFSGLGGDK